MNASTRLTEVESQLAHLQRLYDQLNEVVTDQTMRIDALVRENKRLRDKVERLDVAGESGNLNPQDEKPPHY